MSGKRPFRTGSAGTAGQEPAGLLVPPRYKLCRPAPSVPCRRVLAVTVPVPRVKGSWSVVALGRTPHLRGRAAVCRSVGMLYL